MSHTVAKNVKFRKFNTVRYQILNLLRHKPQGVTSHELGRITGSYHDAIWRLRQQGHVIEQKWLKGQTVIPGHKRQSLWKLTHDAEKTDARTYVPYTLSDLSYRSPDEPQKAPTAPTQSAIDLTSSDTPEGLEMKARELLERARKLRAEHQRQYIGLRNESIAGRWLPKPGQDIWLVAPDGEIYQADFRPGMSGHYAMYWLGMLHETEQKAKQWKDRYFTAFALSV